MERSVRVQNLLSQISELDYQSRLYLVERLIKQLRKKEEEVKFTSRRVTELNSLGSEIWKNVDVDQYVEQERQWD